MSDTVTPLSLRVEAGAKWLDANRPGWLKGIDLDALDLNDCAQCVLGQTFGFYDNGVSVGCGFQVFSEKAGEWSDAHGFSVFDMPWLGCDKNKEHWNALREEWVTAILSRRFIARHQQAQSSSTVNVLDQVAVPV